VEVLFLSCQIGLSLAYPVFVVRRDLARLPPERLARAWNDASLWSAAATLGPLCLIVHFARTRRSWPGFALGLFWAFVGLVALTLVSSLAPD
jgi:hypothetical protein